MSKTFEGTVVSLKMHGTAVVEVFRKKPHPLYRKLLTRSKKYKVETDDLSLSLGDRVKIRETRPMSKDKYFKVEKLVNAKELKTGEIQGKPKKTKKSKKETSEKEGKQV